MIGSGQNILLALHVGYKGTRFSGFAKQENQLTVQGELERALSMLAACPLETVCAGRTDAGVHARSQFVSFDMPFEALNGRSAYSLTRSLNALTHEDIVVHGIYCCSPEFSARFNAQWREYRYYIHEGTTPPLFLDNFVWHIHHKLDYTLMNEAAKQLCGEHDFKSFCTKASSLGKPTTRSIYELEVYPCIQMGEELICVRIRGNAFLHSMVRIIVGSLVEVGKRNKKPLWLKDVLQAQDRSFAGPTAPAKGLTFWDVGYPLGDLVPLDQVWEVLDLSKHTQLYESRDRSLCLIEDDLGHLSLINPARLM